MLVFCVVEGGGESHRCWQWCALIATPAMILRFDEPARPFLENGGSPSPSQLIQNYLVETKVLQSSNKMIQLETEAERTEKLDETG